VIIARGKPNVKPGTYYGSELGASFSAISQLFLDLQIEPNLQLGLQMA
jgi:hypothetical protein